jgi:phenylpropionate dioxygenase-like ring-hydroxylating dioxygenase large terminal subunit
MNAIEPRSLERMRADFAAASRDLADAITLPSYYYKSDEVLSWETSQIFMKEWMCVGRADEIPNPGDYFTLEILGEPLAVTRDNDQEINVFSTVCRHRGARVLEGRGNKTKLMCPFHGWVYSLTGELVVAPRMNRTNDFDKSKACLPRLRTEVWQGFLFINFDPKAKPLAPRLAGLDAKFANYKLHDLRAPAPPMLFTNECNWKLSVEQGIDMYHVPATHPEVADLHDIPATFGEEDPNQAWTTSFTPMKKPHPWVTGTLLGASPFPAIKGLTDFELQSFNMFLVYPNSLIACVPDGALYLLFFPMGPHKTHVRINLCYPTSTLVLPDFEKNLQDSQKGFETLNYQDMGGARLTHEGMESRFLAPGRFSYLERTTWELGKYVIRKLQANVPELRG